MTDVMEKVTVDKRRQLWKGVLKKEERPLPPPSPPLRRPHQRAKSIPEIVDEIYNSHSSEEDKTHTCSDVYVNCCPESSWEHLTSVLYEEDEMTAVDQARPFLPPRGMYSNLVDNQ